MEDLICELIQQGLGSLIDRRRDPIIIADPMYQQLLEELSISETAYDHLSLTDSQRDVIENYMEDGNRLRDRIADLSYITGIRDAVSFLQALGLIASRDSNDSKE